MKAALPLALCLCAFAAWPCLALDDRDAAPGVRQDTDRRNAGDYWERHDDDFDRPHFYLGLGPLYAFEQFHTTSHVFTGGGGTAVGADDSYGAEGRLGYRLHEHVALEAQAQYYGQSDLNAHGPKGSQRVGSFEGVSATGNFKLYPLVGRVQPYVLGGVGLLWAHLKNDLPGARRGNDTELAGRGGLGLDVYLDEHVALNVEGSYLAPASNLKDFPLAAVSGGLQLHF